MKLRNDKYRDILHKTVVFLPLLGVIISSFLPLKTLTRQLLLVVVLVWFQISLMLGDFR